MGKIVIKNKLAVKKIIERFDNKIVYRGSLNTNYITSPIFNRCGLQLATPPSRIKMFEPIESMVVWGTNESNFAASLVKGNDISKVNEMFCNVLSLEPPLIVLCEGFEFTNVVVECAKRMKSKTTIVKCKLHSHMLYFQMAAWINKLLATYQFVHATVVKINGIGVMIQGE